MCSYINISSYLTCLSSLNETPLVTKTNDAPFLLLCEGNILV